MVAKRDIRVGRWVRVKYDDVGAQDGIVIDTSDLKRGNSLRILTTRGSIDWLDVSQVVKMGKEIQAEDSGLDA